MHIQIANRKNNSIIISIFREKSICFKSARWDHPERNIKRLITSSTFKANRLFSEY